MAKITITQKPDVTIPIPEGYEFKIERTSLTSANHVVGFKYKETTMTTTIEKITDAAYCGDPNARQLVHNLIGYVKIVQMTDEDIQLLMSIGKAKKAER